MSEALDNFNTSIEAHKLVKDPTKLFSLLYSKYGDIIEEYQTSLMNQIIFKCSTHLNTQYQEIRFNNIFLEFLRRFYKKKEVKERIPNLYEYYKNYHLFYLKPVLRNFYYVKLLHNYQDKKAEIFYKNNYSKSSNDKSNTDDNSVTSSLSSSDHYTDNKIIFGTKTKLLLEGKKDNSLSIEVSKIKKSEENTNSNNDLRIQTKLGEESTLNDIMKELKTDNNINKKDDMHEKVKDINISSKFRKKKDKKIKRNQNNSRKKNNSPKIYSKSPTFQINHQIHIIKSGNSISTNNTNNNINNITNNIKNNLINPQMYILSQKNSYSNKRNNSHKNKHFSPKMSYYIHNIASKFEEMFKKYPNYFNSMKQRKNKTGNNSNNNTIKKSVNVNNNIYGINNNFQSNFKKFSKLSASLKNSKFNMTYFSQINSNNNSRSSMSAKKSNKLQKNKKIINEINQFNIKTKNSKHKKNKTYDFNMAKGRYIELKKNYTNYNLLRFKPNYTYNTNKIRNANPIGLNFNMMKSPKNNNLGLKNSRDSNEKSGKNTKNKRFVNRKNKIFKNNKKSFVSIASCSSPKFSFIINNKNEPLPKENVNVKNNNLNNNNNINNNNVNNNNIDGNIYNILNNNKNMSKIKKNKYKKNNISYTNNNFNINFNNIFFGSSRPTSGIHANIISDNINTNGNVQINKNININNNYNINSNLNNLSNSNSISLNAKKHTTLIHQNNILNCKNSNINNNYSNNISNLYIKSLNNIYNFSRNKNNKISNCSHTQTQSQTIAKNSKIIRIADSKILVNKTNSFIMNKNLLDDKNINLNINNNNNQKKISRAKMMNQIEDLIMKTKKHVKFGSEHKNKIGTSISNKPTFNNCNNKTKNQSKNRSSYHEMFIKNLKRTSSTSIKVNTKSIANNINNNQAVNVIYKK